MLHTLMAFCDELKAYITGFTRSGNTYTSNGASEMITEIIENLKDSVEHITFHMKDLGEKWQFFFTVFIL